jgi:hypothetical protein
VKNRQFPRTASHLTSKDSSRRLPVVKEGAGSEEALTEAEVVASGVETEAAVASVEETEVGSVVVIAAEVDSEVSDDFNLKVMTYCFNQ